MGTKRRFYVIIGIHKYGFGNWSMMQQDKSLGLMNKISTSENDILPKPNDLKARANTLLKGFRMERERNNRAGKDRSEIKRSIKDESKKPPEPKKSKNPAEQAEKTKPKDSTKKNNQKEGNKR